MRKSVSRLVCCALLLLAGYITGVLRERHKNVDYVEEVREPPPTRPFEGKRARNIGEDIREEDRKELKKFLDWDREHRKEGKNKGPKEEQRPRRRKPADLLMEWTFQA